MWARSRSRLIIIPQDKKGSCCSCAVRVLAKFIISNQLAAGSVLAIIIICRHSFPLQYHTCYQVYNGVNQCPIIVTISSTHFSVNVLAHFRFESCVDDFSAIHTRLPGIYPNSSVPGPENGKPCGYGRAWVPELSVCRVGCSAGGNATGGAQL